MSTVPTTEDVSPHLFCSDTLSQSLSEHSDYVAPDYLLSLLSSDSPEDGIINGTHCAFSPYRSANGTERIAVSLTNGKQSTIGIADGKADGTVPWHWKLRPHEYANCSFPGALNPADGRGVGRVVGLAFASPDNVISIWDPIDKRKKLTIFNVTVPTSKFPKQGDYCNRQGILSREYTDTLSSSTHGIAFVVFQRDARPIDASHTPDENLRFVMGRRQDADRTCVLPQKCHNQSVTAADGAGGAVGTAGAAGKADAVGAAGGNEGAKGSLEPTIGYGNVFICEFDEDGDPLCIWKDEKFPLCPEHAAWLNRNILLVVGTQSNSCVGVGDGADDGEGQQRFGVIVDVATNNGDDVAVGRPFVLSSILTRPRSCVVAGLGIIIITTVTNSYRLTFSQPRIDGEWALTECTDVSSLCNAATGHSVAATTSAVMAVARRATLPQLSHSGNTAAATPVVTFLAPIVRQASGSSCANSDSGTKWTLRTMDIQNIELPSPIQHPATVHDTEMSAIASVDASVLSGLVVAAGVWPRPLIVLSPTFLCEEGRKRAHNELECGGVGDDRGGGDGDDGMVGNSFPPIFNVDDPYIVNLESMQHAPSEDQLITDKQRRDGVAQEERWQPEDLVQHSLAWALRERGSDCRTIVAREVSCWHKNGDDTFGGAGASASGAAGTVACGYSLVGDIDIVSVSSHKDGNTVRIIEVKSIDNWKQAYGQALMYSCHGNVVSSDWNEVDTNTDFKCRSKVGAANTSNVTMEFSQGNKAARTARAARDVQSMLQTSIHDPQGKVTPLLGVDGIGQRLRVSVYLFIDSRFEKQYDQRYREHIQSMFAQRVSGESVDVSFVTIHRCSCGRPFLSKDRAVEHSETCVVASSHT